MRPIRIAHLADTHLGYTALTRVCGTTGRNQRAVDVERAFAAVIDDILAARDIDLVIHAGDVFHHSRPPTPTLIFFLRQMKRLEQAGIPTVVIGGNHDTPRLRSAGSMLDLCAVACAGISFAHGWDWERFRFPIAGREVAVTAVPHGAFTNDAPPDAAPTADGAVNILVAHGAYNLDITTQLRGGVNDIAEALMDERYDYIALGHWHIQERKAANAFYSGSTERMGLADLHATPGYLKVTLNGAGEPHAEHVRVPARDILSLPRVDGTEKTAAAIVDEVRRRLAREDAERRARAMVRCTVWDTPLGVDREVLRLLRGADEVRSCWAFLPDVRAVRAPGAHAETASAIGQVLDEFDAFVADRQTSGLYTAPFAAEFRETGHALLDEALKGKPDPVEAGGEG